MLLTHYLSICSYKLTYSGRFLMKSAKQNLFVKFALQISSHILGKIIN